MNKSAIKNGLIYGGVASIIFLALYLIVPELTFNIGMSLLISLVVPILFMRSGIIGHREENEGQITFGEGLMTGMVVFFIGSLLFNLTNAVVIAVDSNYKELGETILYDKSIEAMEMTANMFNMPEDAKQAALDQLNNKPPEITMVSFFIGFLFSLILPGVLLALVMAAILKRT